MLETRVKFRKECTKICGNTSRVSPRDEVAKNACSAEIHSQTGIKSRFVNSSGVALSKLAQVQFISAIAGYPIAFYGGTV